MLTTNELLESFNLTSYRLKKIKDEFQDGLSLSKKDWIYGALRTLNISTVHQIGEYIDYKNRVSLTNNDLIDGLNELQQEGLVYSSNGNWNFCSRLIEVYANDSDDFISEVELGIFEIDKMREIFNPNKEDYLMYDLYKISKNEIENFLGLVSVEFSIDKYEYFLTCRQGEKK